MEAEKKTPPEKEENGNVGIPIKADMSELDAAIAKAERLSELLKEAKSLAGEIASITVRLEVEV